MKSFIGLIKPVKTSRQKYNTTIEKLVLNKGYFVNDFSRKQKLRKSDNNKPETIKSLRLKYTYPQVAWADLKSAIYGDSGIVKTNRYVAFAGYFNIQSMNKRIKNKTNWLIVILIDKIIPITISKNNNP